MSIGMLGCSGAESARCVAACCVLDRWMAWNRILTTSIYILDYTLRDRVDSTEE